MDNFWGVKMKAVFDYSGHWQQGERESVCVRERENAWYKEWNQNEMGENGRMRLAWSLQSKSKWDRNLQNVLTSSWLPNFDTIVWTQIPFILENGRLGSSKKKVNRSFLRFISFCKRNVSFNTQVKENICKVASW